MVSLYDFFCAILHIIFATDQYNFRHPALLKCLQAVIDHWFPIQIHILFWDITLHSFSTARRQYNRRICAHSAYLIFIWIRLFRKVLPSFCFLQCMAECLAFSEFQIRNRIQIKSISLSGKEIIVCSCSDHGCIICTKNRGWMIELYPLFFACIFHCSAQCAI